MNNPAEHLRDILIEPAPDLFYSRNDSADTRMGDIVLRKLEGYVPEVTVGIIGAPQDEGVRRNKGRTGAKNAPTEIRRALYKLTPFSPDQILDDDITSLRIFDFGDIREGYTLEETHEHLQYAVEVLLDNNIIPIVLGGGHDIAYPNFAGFSQTAINVGVINIDAHLDYRPAMPERHSGSSFRQMLDDADAKLRPENLVEFGVQPFVNSAAYYRELIERGVQIHTLEQITTNSEGHSFEDALRTASENTDRIMVSFDLDSVQSSDAPGVSAPSSQGFSASEILRYAFYSGRHYSTQLIDIVEVNPIVDADGRTSRLAALIIMNFLNGFLQR